MTLEHEDIFIILGVYFFLSHCVFISAICHLYFKARRLGTQTRDVSTSGDTPLLEDELKEIEVRKVKRTQSAPQIRKNKVLSEYDSLMGCSMPRQDVPLPQPPETGHYDEVVDPATASPNGIPLVNSHQYDIILDQVATTLSVVYNDKAIEINKNIYEKFMSELSKRIKMKETELFQTNKNFTIVNNNHYTEIHESNNNNNDSDEESTYATYIPPKNDVKNSEVRFISHSNVIRKMTSFGSADHKKFLIESKKVVNHSKDSLYLEPTRYSATSNCPESLRKLCLNQVNDDSLQPKVPPPVPQKPKSRSTLSFTEDTL